VALTSSEFRDGKEYKKSTNAVDMFSQMRKRDAFAADLLVSMPCVD
jgi:hypothetical protein